MSVEKCYRQKDEKRRILIFSGTTEGNRIAQALCELPVKVYVSVATEYGKVCAKEWSEAEVVSGRMDTGEIEKFLRDHQIEMVIDATHPFARVVTENVRNVCLAMKTTYIRCVRDVEELEKTDRLKEEQEVWVENIEQAVTYLEQTTGNVLLTTGGKELHKYTKLSRYQERCYARVLSTEKSIKDAITCGFEGKHLIAMQGPFSKEMNIALLHYAAANYLVTKESGKAGGFEEKLEAAKEAGAKIVVIRRPTENGYSVDETIKEVVRWIEKNGGGKRPEQG